MYFDLNNVLESQTHVSSPLKLGHLDICLPSYLLPSGSFLHSSLLFSFARPPTHFSLKASKSLSLSFAYSHTHSSSDPLSLAQVFRHNWLQLEKAKN